MLESLPLDLSESQKIWGLFVALIAAVLLLERMIFARADSKQGTPVAATVGVLGLCMLAAGAFAYGLTVLGGPAGLDRAAAFGTIYVVEFALSIDNLFVFLLIFNAFAVRAQEARRILTWGIVGAIVLRGLFIVVGASLFSRFEWLFYFVGVFLLISGVRLLLPKKEEHSDPAQHWAVTLGRKVLPMASAQAVAQGPKGAFMVREHGLWRLTPLVLVLLAVEASDVVFALDSVPASFAITTDTPLVFFANMFAVMGLRCLYALLAHAADTLKYLHVALAAILMLIGLKMLTRHIVHVPDGLFLGTVMGLLVLSALASKLLARPEGASH